MRCDACVFLCHYAQCLMRPYPNMRVMLFLLRLPDSTAIHLSGDVGSNQLDISTVGGGAGGIAHLPQELVLGAKAEVRRGTVDVAQSEAALKRVRSSGGV